MIFYISRDKKSKRYYKCYIDKTIFERENNGYKIIDKFDPKNVIDRVGEINDAYYKDRYLLIDDYQLLFPDMLIRDGKIWLMKYMISKIENPKIKYNNFNNNKLVEIYDNLYQDAIDHITLKNRLQTYWYFYVDNHPFTKFCIDNEIGWKRPTLLKIIKAFNIFSNSMGTIKNKISTGLSKWFEIDTMVSPVQIKKVLRVYAILDIIDPNEIGPRHVILLCYMIIAMNKHSSYFETDAFIKKLLYTIVTEMECRYRDLDNDFIKKHSNYFAGCKNIRELKIYLNNTVLQMVEKSTRDFKIIDKEIWYMPRINIERQVVEFLKDVKTRVKKNLLQAIDNDEPHVNDDAWVEDLHPMTDEQKNALRNICHYKFSIITGGPGTGKTATIQQLIKFANRTNTQLHILAPTSKASRSYKGYIDETFTIHKYLVCDETVNDGCVIVIDEISMVNTELMLNLFEKIKGVRYHLCFVGDPDQLPPVDGIAFFPALVKSDIPKIILSVIQRAGDPNLQLVYNNIRNGIVPKNNETYLQKSDKSQLEYIKQIIDHADKNYYSLLDGQPLLVLGFTNAQVAEMNIKLQEFWIPHLKKVENPNHDIHYTPNHVKFLTNGKNTFNMYDRVLVNKNCYQHQVFNGDEGIIIEMTNDRILIQIIDNTLEYSNYRAFERNCDCCDLDVLSLAYCRTIHKSQGGQSKNIFIKLPESSHYINRKHVYTAVTRAQEKVYINVDVNLYLQKIEVYNVKLLEFLRI